MVENDTNNSNFCDCESNLKVQPFKLNLWSSTSLLFVFSRSEEVNLRLRNELNLD